MLRHHAISLEYRDWRQEDESKELLLQPKASKRAWRSVRGIGPEDRVIEIKTSDDDTCLYSEVQRW